MLTEQLSSSLLAFCHTFYVAGTGKTERTFSSNRKIGECADKQIDTESSLFLCLLSLPYSSHTACSL